MRQYLITSPMVSYSDRHLLDPPCSKAFTATTRGFIYLQISLKMAWREFVGPSVQGETGRYIDRENGIKGNREDNKPTALNIMTLTGEHEVKISEAKISILK